MSDDRETLLALAERCEKASGADRELDCRIWSTFNGGGFDTYRTVVPDLRQWRAAYYTASLDAALTLAPEGWAWTLGQNVHHRHWQASINALDDDGAPYSVAHGGTGNVHTTPALALTAAALRARAALLPEEGA